MLLEFSVSNHKSIRAQITFSMIAGSDDSDEDRLMYYDRYRVLRSAVIYGANGSGKSNFVDAVRFVRNLVVNSITNQPGEGIAQVPHKLSGFDEDSSYSIQFTQADVRYAFGFTLRGMLVTDEYLYCFPKGRQVVIYERDSEKFVPGNKFRDRFDSCRDVFKPNRLFLSCAANFSSVPEIENAYTFFKSGLIVYRGLGTDEWMNYSLGTMEQNKGTKAEVLDLLGRLGTGIKDIEIVHSSQNAAMPLFISDDFRARYEENLFDIYNTRVKYDQFSVELKNESTGIRKLLEFVCPLVDIIKNDKVLVCDEMEANFHESLVYAFVKLFRNLEPLRHSQLIFTTHDTSILDLSIFRRDQIWFTELTKDSRSTDLYSLSEIRNVRKDENIVRGYISGKYGAIPMLNSDLKGAIETGA